MTRPQLYAYPQANAELIRRLGLEPHPEGGHFAVTHVSSEKVASPFASGQEARPLQSTIYYLLSANGDAADGEQTHDTHASPTQKVYERCAIGVMHKNKSTTMHLHHAGRVVYTLLSNSRPVQKKTVVMGDDMSKGEVRQLLVEGDWWKVSEVPAEDRHRVESGEIDGSYVGGLISEVVTPGFDWKDHTYMDPSDLHTLFGSDEEEIAKYMRYCGERK